MVMLAGAYTCINLVYNFCLNFHTIREQFDRNTINSQDRLYEQETSSAL